MPRNMEVKINLRINEVRPVRCIHHRYQLVDLGEEIFCLILFPSTGIIDFVLSRVFRKLMLSIDSKNIRLFVCAKNNFETQNL